MTSPQAPQNNLKSRNFLDKFKNFLNISKQKRRIKLTFAILASPIVIQAYNFFDSVVKTQILAEKKEKITEVSTYTSFGKVLETYQGKVGSEIANILGENPKYKSVFSGSGNFCDELLNQYKSGAKIYYSKDFSDYRDVHNFFETLSFLIDKEVIDFDLVFEVVAFPGEFPEGKYPKDSTLSPLIAFDECIGKNWFGKGHDLLDYGAAIKRLGYNYNYERMKLIVKTKTGEEEEKARQTVKKIEENQCRRFYPSDPNSDKAYWNKLYPKGYGIIRSLRSINFRC